MTLKMMIMTAMREITKPRSNQCVLKRCCLLLPIRPTNLVNLKV